MYYTVGHAGFRRSGHWLWVSLVIGIGLVIGGCAGVYFAARTLPLPHDYTPVYIIK